MKKYIIISIVICFCICCNNISSNEEVKKTTTNILEITRIPLEEKITTEYSLEDLYDFFEYDEYLKNISTSFKLYSKSISQVHDTFPIECFMSAELNYDYVYQGQIYYCVYKVKEGGIFVVGFDNHYIDCNRTYSYYGNKYKRKPDQTISFANLKTFCYVYINTKNNIRFSYDYYSNITSEDKITFDEVLKNEPNAFVENVDDHAGNIDKRIRLFYGNEQMVCLYFLSKDNYEFSYLKGIIRQEALGHQIGLEVLIESIIRDGYLKDYI